MNRYFKIIAISCLASVTLQAGAAEVPVTSLTKNCKSLVNTKLKIVEPPLVGQDERTYKRVTRAQELLAEGNYAEGIAALKKIEESARSDYEKATINLQLAFAYAQNDKQAESFPYFQNALKYGETTLPSQQVQSLRQNVAGLMYGIGKKDKAIELMLQWMKSSNVEKPEAYYFLAALYADPDTNKFEMAICPAYFAAKLEKEPKKSYFSLLLFANWELKDVVGTSEILKSMVEYFPEEKTYWRQLSQIYLSLDKVKESLALMEMFYLRNQFENENDYKTLSSLFSYESIPFRSAEILEEGIRKGLVKNEDKNWRNIARNYHSSNELEKAIAAYGKTAEVSSDGNDYFKQGELYSDSEQWNLAITSINKALDKGNLDDVGRAYLRKGVALVNIGKCESGMNALAEAVKFKKHSASANGWTDYAKEKQRANKC